MNKKREESLCKWLDERWEMALDWDKRMGNTSDEFLPNNPNYIYYKGALDCLNFCGFDWQRTKGKHIIWKL